jgi:hypothetical protein
MVLRSVEEFRRWAHSADPNSLSSRFRRARSKWIIELIQSTSRAKSGDAVRILDLGGRSSYWLNVVGEAFLNDHKVHITLVNTEPVEGDGRLFESRTGDACDLREFADESFDITHSNSVIEHVGDWERQAAFARESRRLAPRYYVQTPYYYFPIEPHVSAVGFHWRSEHARARRLIRGRVGRYPRASDVGKAMEMIQSARLLDKAQFRCLFPDAQLAEERILGLTKSLIAIRG